MKEEIAFINVGNKSHNLAAGLFGKASAMPDAPRDPFSEVNTVSYEKRFEAQPLLMWGEDNTFPHLIDAAARKVGVLQQGLAKLNRYFYNQGIFTYKEVEQDGDTMRIQIVRDEDIEAFLNDSLIYRFFQKAINDYTRYGNYFPLHQLNEQRKVVRLRCIDAPYCRIEKPHPKTGRSENLYVSAQWPYGLELTSSKIPDNFKDLVDIYPMLDEYDAVDQMLVMKGEYNFARHVKYISSGREYGEVPWHSVYFNKWLNISASVPELKERLFMYAMTINYVAYIDDSYWTTVYGKEWGSWTAEKKAEKMKDVQDSIENKLIGKDNSWKTLFASMRYAGNDGNARKSIIIEAINNKLREGTFIPDNLHANGEILTAIGIDPCLLGATVLGDKVSAGSGSNIREAMLALIASLRGDRDLMLEELRIVQAVNGWDSEIKFGFKDYIINTLDGRAPTAGKEAVNG